MLGLLVCWFAWPAKELEPRGLPVVVAGPAPAAAAVAQRLEAARPGAFEVTTVRRRGGRRRRPARPGGVRRLRRRPGRAQPAHRLGGQPDRGGAAHPGRAAARRHRARRSPWSTSCPASPDDPRGAGFASGFLPLVAGRHGRRDPAGRPDPVEGRRAWSGCWSSPRWPGLVGAGVMAGSRRDRRRLPRHGGRDRADRAGRRRDRGRARVGARPRRHRPRRAARLPVRQPASPA